MKVKIYEIFTTDYSSIIQAYGIVEAVEIFLVDHRVTEECCIIAIVEKTHQIAKEFGIA